MGRIKRLRDKIAADDPVIARVAETLGNFLGLAKPENEDAAKDGMRLAGIRLRKEIMDACDRVREWCEEVDDEEFVKLAEGVYAPEGGKP